jgi:hypothetical protein
MQNGRLLCFYAELAKQYEFTYSETRRPLKSAKILSKRDRRVCNSLLKKAMLPDKHHTPITTLLGRFRIEVAKWDVANKEIQDKSRSESMKAEDLCEGLGISEL